MWSWPKISPRLCLQIIMLPWSVSHLPPNFSTSPNLVPTHPWRAVQAINSTAHVWKHSFPTDPFCCTLNSHLIWEGWWGQCLRLDFLSLLGEVVWRDSTSMPTWAPGPHLTYTKCGKGWTLCFWRKCSQSKVTSNMRGRLLEIGEYH